MKGIHLSNLQIFPLLKKYPLKNNAEKIDVESIPEDEIDAIAMHYTKQLVHAFDNQGFPDTGLYFQDITFMQDVMRSLLLRSVNKHDPLQDLVDSIFDNEVDESYNEESDVNKPENITEELKEEISSE